MIEVREIDALIDVGVEKDDGVEVRSFPLLSLYDFARTKTSKSSHFNSMEHNFPT